jgi:hypothetical protein
MRLNLFWLLALMLASAIVWYYVHLKNQGQIAASVEEAASQQSFFAALAQLIF